MPSVKEQITKSMENNRELINRLTYSQLNFDKGTKGNSMQKDHLSTNGARTVKHPHFKK